MLHITMCSFYKHETCKIAVSINKSLWKVAIGRATQRCTKHFHGPSIHETKSDWFDQSKARSAGWQRTSIQKGTWPFKMHYIYSAQNRICTRMANIPKLIGGHQTMGAIWQTTLTCKCRTCLQRHPHKKCCAWCNNDWNLKVLIWWNYDRLLVVDNDRLPL